MTAVEQAKELVQGGLLHAAIESVTQAVKGDPVNGMLRTVLFELLCFAGDWDRAEKQLDVIGHQDAKTEIGVLTYRQLIAGEKARRRVFEQGVQPHFFQEPPSYIDRQLRALMERQQGLSEAAAKTLDEAMVQWPRLGGRINGRRFDEFRDADDTLGPVLEVLARDQYAWLPFEQISRVEFQAPKRLRDALWVEARIEMKGHKLAQVFVPALYVQSSEQPDERLKLGRMTNWLALGNDRFQGIGQRMFWVDSSEESILGLRNIHIESNTRR
ncbi:MAG TPA: type VI secretion system accessory protein TagJ [Nitrospira sp.]|nr:type VI secretion system accessory protein TagJ [Nitrospira sp.]